MTSSIVYDFIIGLYRENTPTDELKQGIQSFIENRVGFDELKELSENITGNSSPIYRLRSIMECDTNTTLNIARYPLPGKKTRPWLQNEDNRLLAAIHKYGTKNWDKVSDFVGSGRQKSQCAQRYSRILNPTISKENWTEEETNKLIELVKVEGDKKWTVIAELMGNRTDVQCRYRYKQAMKKRKSESKSNAKLSSSYAQKDKTKNKDDNKIKKREKGKVEEKASIENGTFPFITNEIHALFNEFESDFWV